MANPFLVLGGVAVGVITAGIGVLAVPGWINGSQDSAAHNDLAQVAAAQSVALTESGQFQPSLAALNNVESVKVQKSAGVRMQTFTDPEGEDWVTVAKSQTGTYFARLSKGSTVGSGETIVDAVTAAGTTVTSGITAEGVPIPTADWQIAEEFARNYAQNPLAIGLAGYSTHGTGYSSLSSITDFPGDISTAVRSTLQSGNNTRILDILGGDGMPSAGQQLRVTLEIRTSAAMAIFLEPRQNRQVPNTNVGERKRVDLPAGVSTVDVALASFSGVPATAASGVTIIGAAAAGTTIDVTKVSITEAESGIGFFHGDTGTIAGGTTYWTGPQNASAAVVVR